MHNVTISVSDDLKKRMEENNIINWSEVARKAITKQIDELELLNRLTKDIKITDEQIEEISKKIKHGMAKRNRM